MRGHVCSRAEVLALVSNTKPIHELRLEASSLIGITQRHPPIYIFSHPRTRSNLLARLLETHPQIADAILYPHRAAHIKGPERRVKDGTLFAVKPEELSPVHTYQYCHDEMQASFEAMYEKGLIPLVKEHVIFTMSTSVVNSQIPNALKPSYPVIADTEKPPSTNPNSNPMILPASFLASITPIFTIRHPIPLITSWMNIILGTYGENYDKLAVWRSCSFRWTRTLFDYYRVSGKTAIVIDGDELVRDTKNQMEKLCSLIGPGVDGSGIQYEWKPKASYMAVDEKMKEDVFLRVLYESTGVIVNEERLKPPNLDEEMTKWTEKWGVDVANKLKDYAQAAIEDYDYLLQYRL
ncbi:hypothetical protein V5O48_011156 [Marasmius crinis-equi]|uniref:Sulfotransferase n=1 Tax=Marasmius crinis-equi TaxID=585013 RepID=A0ABR3F6T3_9AGAR